MASSAVVRGRPVGAVVVACRCRAVGELVHTVPGKHFPQEDQAPAIAPKIAELAGC